MMIGWVLGGLLVTIGIVMLFFYKKRKNTNNAVTIAIAVNILTSGLVVLISQLLGVWGKVWPFLSVAVITSIITAIAIKKIFSPNLDPTSKRQLDAAKKLGLQYFWYNYAEDFSNEMKQDFGSYIRQKLKNTTGNVRTIGIDWTELFGSGVSGTSEYYEDLLQKSNLSLQALLLDPRVSYGLEKRMAEFKYRPLEGSPKYQKNHPDRVCGKIIGSAEILSDYHRRYPQRVQYRFTKVPPMICAFITDEEVIFYLYFINLKGWDSPLFVIKKTEEYCLYKIISDYFEYSWDNLEQALSDKEWEDWRSRLVHQYERFNQIIKKGCEHETDQVCKVLFDQS